MDLSEGPGQGSDGNGGDIAVGFVHNMIGKGLAIVPRAMEGKQVCLGKGWESNSSTHLALEFGEHGSIQQPRYLGEQQIDWAISTSGKELQWVGMVKSTVRLGSSASCARKVRPGCLRGLNSSETQAGSKATLLFGWLAADLGRRLSDFLRLSRLDL